MKAAEAFDKRKDALLVQFETAGDVHQAISSAVLALEMVAGDLAQDEQDALARQRQQAVLALARRAPLFLDASRAQARMIDLGEKKRCPLVSYGKTAGMLLLCALALFEAIDGRALFAAVQLVGAALVMLLPAQMCTQKQLQGVRGFDAQTLLGAVGEMCQAADLCIADLSVLDMDAQRLSGTADEAMIDLLVSLMEAKASGREEVAMRSLDQVQAYLRMLGIQAIYYAPGQEAYFDLLPTMGESRTVRPALMQEGRLLRRGVAACCAERGMRG